MAGRKDWDPRKGVRAVEALEALARDMVGDGKSPNLFFVTVEGKVILISQDFEPAYKTWRYYSFPIRTETGIEDRQYGVMAAVEPDEDESGRLVRRFDMGPNEMEKLFLRIDQRK